MLTCVVSLYMLVILCALMTVPKTAKLPGVGVSVKQKPPCNFSGMLFKSHEGLV